MRLDFDAESGGLYIGVREGRVEQTLDLAEPNSVLLWTSMAKAKSWASSFSLKEYIELITRFDSVLELSDKIEVRAVLSIPSRG